MKRIMASQNDGSFGSSLCANLGSGMSRIRRSKSPMSEYLGGSAVRVPMTTLKRHSFAQRTFHAATTPR